MEIKQWITGVAPVGCLLIAYSSAIFAASARKPTSKEVSSTTLKKSKEIACKPGEMVVLPVPRPFPGIARPYAIPSWSTIDRKKLGKRQGPYAVPCGTHNIALHKTVTSSDERPIIGTLDLITDGKTESTDGNWVEIAPGKQWVQIDLKKPYKIYAIILWHFNAEFRIYRDVVVQVSNNPIFTTNVRTIYNNDHDNTLGLGPGPALEYGDNSSGKFIEAKNITARYVRLYSNGNSYDEQNHYTEVAVYGK